MGDINWEIENILWIANELQQNTEAPDTKVFRGIIEPWLTAVFQSEHISLLLGTGITTAVAYKAEVSPQAMERIEFDSYKRQISKYAELQAKEMNRGIANFEDDLRTAIELYKGLEILGDDTAEGLKGEINEKLKILISNLMLNEHKVLTSDKGFEALQYLKRFIISFASRTATRDRLNIFTTNYDRFIEYALDSAGIHTIDRFVGKLNPTLRMNKMELDYHYNPPGIRGEPRYVEGVVRYTKLHGSLDWKMQNKNIVKEPISFGVRTNPSDIEDPFDTKVIYPSSAKGIETVFFPYSELFRDFSAAICRPNSVLVTYGYGFGDSHINNIILDMMQIPSTHLVIMSYDNASGRIPEFVKKCNSSQLTLIIGRHFGDISNLVDHYLPKSAIDRISERRYKIEESRGITKGFSEVKHEI